MDLVQYFGGGGLLFSEVLEVFVDEETKHLVRILDSVLCYLVRDLDRFWAIHSALHCCSRLRKGINRGSWSSSRRILSSSS